MTNNRKPVDEVRLSLSAAKEEDGQPLHIATEGSLNQLPTKHRKGWTPAPTKPAYSQTNVNAHLGHKGRDYDAILRAAKKASVGYWEDAPRGIKFGGQPLLSAVTKPHGKDVDTADGDIAMPTKARTIKEHAPAKPLRKHGYIKCPACGVKLVWPYDERCDWCNCPVLAQRGPLLGTGSGKAQETEMNIPIEQFIQKLTEQLQAAMCREEMPSEYISDLIAMLKAAIEGLEDGINTMFMARDAIDAIPCINMTEADQWVRRAKQTLARINTLATEALGTKGER